MFNVFASNENQFHTILTATDLQDIYTYNVYTITYYRYNLICSEIYLDFIFH